MTARYDMPRLHADCLAWCEKPVFPYPWQTEWTIKTHEMRGLINIENRHHLVYADFETDIRNTKTDQICTFAHLIGLDVEPYRIKETYKTAVIRYLETIKDGQPIYEGSRFKTGINSEFSSNAGIYMRGGIKLADPIGWADDSPWWADSYELLRLDLNPDYKID